MTLSKTFYNLLFEQDLIVATPLTSKFSSLSHSSRKPLLEIYYYNYKDKAIPLQAWADPEGSRRLRLPDFKTFGT